MEIELSGRVNPANWPEAYKAYLFSFSMNRLKNKQKAEDMVQDTFLKALSTVHEFTGTCSERTWLTAILKNNIYDLQRRDSKFSSWETIEEENELHSSTTHWEKDEIAGHASLQKSDLLEKKEVFVFFEKCLNDLPVQWASAFYMKHLDDEKSETICEQLNISAGNLWTIMHRAKLKLRACMEYFGLNRFNN